VTNVNYCGNTAVCNLPQGVPCVYGNGIAESGYGCPCASAADCVGGHCGIPGSWQSFNQPGGNVNTNFPSGYTQTAYTQNVCYCPTWLSATNGGPAYDPSSPLGCCASPSDCKNEGFPCNSNISGACSNRGSCDPIQHLCQIHVSGITPYYYNQGCTLPAPPGANC